MDSGGTRGLTARFRDPEGSIGALNPDSASALVSASADVALILGPDGIIRDAAFNQEDLGHLGIADWPGRSWFDVATPESRAKLEDLLTPEVDSPRWREVIHLSQDGEEVPIRYVTLRLDDGVRVLAIGRDMQSVATAQQRLVEAQLSMEREYARLRRAESRYRLLFQISGEAMLILEGKSFRVLEANPAAAQMLGRDEKKLVGTNLATSFDAASRAGVQELLNQLRETGEPGAVSATGADNDAQLRLAVSMFRQEGTSYLLVRLADAAQAPAGGAAAGEAAHVLRVIESSPEAFALTDLAGRLLEANPAFLDLCQCPSLEAARKHPISRWLGRSNVDFNVLMANLKEHGAVRMFATSMRNEFGGLTDVEISAVSVAEAETPCIGFMIRNAEGRLPVSLGGESPFPKSLEQISKLVGRVPLKDLVQESTDIIERLCIEAALELTGDNRASAAEMLGLSRQSLYVKLRRYGLGNLSSE